MSKVKWKKATQQKKSAQTFFRLIKLHIFTGYVYGERKGNEAKNYMKL